MSSESLVTFDLSYRQKYLLDSENARAPVRKQAIFQQNVVMTFQLSNGNTPTWGETGFKSQNDSRCDDTTAFPKDPEGKKKHSGMTQVLRPLPGWRHHGEVCMLMS